jgi:hypothetical protein
MRNPSQHPHPFSYPSTRHILSHSLALASDLQAMRWHSVTPPTPSHLAAGANFRFFFSSNCGGGDEGGVPIRTEHQRIDVSKVDTMCTHEEVVHVQPHIEAVGSVPVVAVEMAESNACSTKGLCSVCTRSSTSSQELYATRADCHKRRRGLCSLFLYVAVLTTRPALPLLSTWAFAGCGCHSAVVWHSIANADGDQTTLNDSSGFGQGPKAAVVNYGCER